MPSGGKGPNIIMIHDERASTSVQDEGIKVPAGYGKHFKIVDGQGSALPSRDNGGTPAVHRIKRAGWLSSRSSALLPNFVTRIASRPGRARTPLARRRCGGYSNGAFIDLSPLGFMSAPPSSQTTTRHQHFYDGAHDLGAKDVEPDGFCYDKRCS